MARCDSCSCPCRLLACSGKVYVLTVCRCLPSPATVAHCVWSQGFVRVQKSTQQRAHAMCAGPQCKRKHDLKLCVGCRSVAYCGRDCQKAAWKGGHKQECRELRQRDNQVGAVAGMRAAPPAATASGAGAAATPAGGDASSTSAASAANGGDAAAASTEAPAS